MAIFQLLDFFLDFSWILIPRIVSVFLCVRFIFFFRGPHEFISPFSFPLAVTRTVFPMIFPLSDPNRCP